MEPEWRKYIVASLPEWLIAIVVALVLYRMAHLPLWTGAMLVAGWIAVDLVTFPRRRRFYTSEAARRRIVGERGVAASDVSSQGFVRVHGELWQARAADPAAAGRGSLNRRIARAAPAPFPRPASTRGVSPPQFRLASPRQIR